MNAISRSRDRDLDHQIDVLNNLDTDKMETKSKSNFYNTEQNELSKLSNDESIVIKPTAKGWNFSNSYNMSLPKHDNPTSIGWKYLQQTRLLHP